MTTTSSPNDRTDKRSRSWGHFEISVHDRPLYFRTQAGVFSQDGPDDGSMLLLDTVIPLVKPHMKVLDIGAGVGLLGISLSTILTRGEAWMVDSDVRAVRLLEENVKLNNIPNVHVQLGDITLDLPAKLRFDLVVSNPPTHSGKDVLASFVNESYDVLRPGASLMLVVNRLLSVRAVMADRFGQVEVVAKRKGFLILRSEKVRHSARHDDCITINESL